MKEPLNFPDASDIEFHDEATADIGPIHLSYPFVGRINFSQPTPLMHLSVKSPNGPVNSVFPVENGCRNIFQAGPIPQTVECCFSDVDYRVVEEHWPMLQFHMIMIFRGSLPPYVTKIELEIYNRRLGWVSTTPRVLRELAQQSNASSPKAVGFEGIGDDQRVMVSVAGNNSGGWVSSG